MTLEAVNCYFLKYEKSILILSFLIKFHQAVKTPKNRKDFLVFSQSNWGQMLTLLHSSLMLDQGKGKGFGL